MKSTPKTIVAIRRDKGDSSDFLLSIIDGKYNSHASVTHGRIIQQTSTKSQQQDVVFQARESVTIRSENILEAIEVQCREESGKFIISHAEFERISADMARNSEDSDDSAEEEGDSDCSDSQEMRPQTATRKRGRPKGSKNRKKNNNKSYSDSDDEDMYEEKKRGRGRPKGSRNKKNMRKEDADRDINLRALMGGHLAKCVNRSNSKVQSSDNTLRDDDRSEKRGKGRPKGSKNRSKLELKLMEKSEQASKAAMAQQQNLQKRHRGRPKGVKNRPREEPEQSQTSSFDMQYDLELESISAPGECCERCTDKLFKERILQDKSAHQALRILKQCKSVVNIAEDVRLERRENVFLWALKANSLPLVRECLNHIKKTRRFFRSVWQTEGKIDCNRFSTRTRKEALSKSGKEGIVVLLHDAPHINMSEKWWVSVGIERILECMSNQTKKQIIDCLISHHQALEQCLYENIPILIRCGNFKVAKYLIKDIVPTQYNKYGYSRQHLECLDEANSKIQFKKNNILKQNFCSNFCSPIHCAAVNSNAQLLEYLLTNIPDYNVGDSLNMKPVHYAAAALTKTNLEVLVKHSSDLKDMDKHKMTPLMVAAYHGRTENVQYILQTTNEATYINFLSEEGYSALHYAVLKGHIGCVNILLNNPHVRIDIQSKQKQTVMHLVCGTGNLEIFKELVNAGLALDCYDKHSRTPIMFAVRNHNHGIVEEIIRMKGKYYKEDSSFNTVLHYAAAFGNLRFLPYLLERMRQKKNKRSYYPWEIAVGKGHIGCAMILQQDSSLEQQSFAFVNNLAMMMFRSVDGTEESLTMIQYLVNSKKYNLNELDSNGSNVLHYVCGIGLDDYMNNRGTEDRFISFDEVQRTLIELLLSKNVESNLVNKKNHSPIDLCVENGNIVGMKLLLTLKVSLNFESTSGMTILHYLSKIASKDRAGMEFVIERLCQLDKNSLKESLKKIDINGFEAILYFVRDFTYEVIKNYTSMVLTLTAQLANGDGQLSLQEQTDIHRVAFQEFVKHEQQFIKLVYFLMEQGCDANVQVVEKRKEDDKENLKKWGIQHFLMRFPSSKLLSLFRRKIRDFNSQNNSGMTALHLFCSWIKKGNLFGAQIELPQMSEYSGEKSLQFLLENGLNPNILDMNRSTPLLYSALNGQISFMILLRRFGSIINNCNNKNQVPFIEIIKMKNSFTLEQIESVLKIGADPNYEDLEKRTSLHHIVYNSTNLDSSPELCKILFQYNVKINSLDKYNRTPLFYCFTRIDLDQKDTTTPINDKMEILQVLINHKDININHVDVYHRTALHYACEKNYFFSIMYLLETSANIDTQIKDYEGNTPLAICLKHRNLNQAALLLKRGIKQGDVVDADKKYSYFSYAIHKLSAGICYMLLDNGYPIDKALRETTSEVFKSQLIKRYNPITAN